jgi:hypothetical protein
MKCYHLWQQGWGYGTQCKMNHQAQKNKYCILSLLCDSQNVDLIEVVSKIAVMRA